MLLLLLVIVVLAVVLLWCLSGLLAIPLITRGLRASGAIPTPDPTTLSTNARVGIGMAVLSFIIALVVALGAPEVHWATAWFIITGLVFGVLPASPSLLRMWRTRRNSSAHH